MSQGYRNGAFALGLITGGGIALNLFLWLDYKAQKVPNTSAPNQSQTDGNEIGDHWHRFIDTFVSPSDTLAQWIMAVFTIAATIVLVFTLRSANKTNQAAVEAAAAASNTNEIMRQERRPWVTLSREIACDFHDIGHGGLIVWNYNFTNKGNGPAYDVKLDFKLIKRNHLQYMPDQLEAFVSNVLKKDRFQGNAILFPNETTNHRRFIGQDMSRYPSHDFHREDGSETFIMLMACVTYRLSSKSNVFGYDARMFEIEESKRWLGPLGHTLPEHGFARTIG